MSVVFLKNFINIFDRYIKQRSQEIMVRSTFFFINALEIKQIQDTILVIYIKFKVGFHFYDNKKLKFPY